MSIPSVIHLVQKKATFQNRNLVLSCMYAIVILVSPTILIAQEYISGRVFDVSSDQPLPYATIVLRGTAIGTTSDSEGNFHFNSGNTVTFDSLDISYVGFESVRVGTQDRSALMNIQLIPSSEILKEIVVRPLTAEEYLSQVQRKLAVNNAQFSFNTISHYQESITEDQQLIGHNEGIFKSWHSTFQEGATTHHQLALHRQEKIERLDFMHKKAAKEKKKYIEKNPDKADDFEDDQLFIADLGGPKGLLEMNPNGKSFEILDSTLHKHFDFKYLDESTYMDSPLTVIAYTSKGQIDHRKCSGIIYLERNSDAVVAIKESGTLIIPILIRPILFAMGLSIESPGYSLELKSRPINGRWYPQYLLRELNLGMKKKHLFQKNEKARFEINQSMTFSEISIDSVQDIPTNKAFDTDKKMSEQVYPIVGLNWWSVSY